MFTRLGNLLLILALLGATGTHWVMLQSVAWATMLAENARTDSLPSALEKTFDGKHPCALCKQITKGRASEKSKDARVEFKQLEFLRQSGSFSLTSPANFNLIAQNPVLVSLLTWRPPVPPPRVSIA
jgi:hypothetical protein